MSLREFFRIVLVSSFVLMPISRALAQVLPNPVAIGDVTIIPEEIITPVDEVSLEVRLVSGSCCIGLLEPTQVQILDNEILVDLFAGSGLLAIPDAHVETVPLGTFGPGTYFYEVTQSGPSISQSQVSGSFQVVPEPSTAAMIVIAITLLLFGFCSSDGRRELAEVWWSCLSLRGGLPRLTRIH